MIFVAEWCNVVAACCRVLQCVVCGAVCLLHCVAVAYDNVIRYLSEIATQLGSPVLQCVAVCCRL